jgi:hypothetical protein
MIIAIEGPSAAGKTTWCRSYCPAGFVAAAPEKIEAPSLFADPREVAEFWVNFNIERWQNALRLERERGIAFCDGDPFELRFSWAAWKAEEIPSTLFKIELPLYRRAIEEKRLGFADLVACLDAPIEELRRRAKADETRRRKRHELYLRMIPWMNAWAGAREQVLPGAVRALTEESFMEDFARPPALARRYDVTVIDAMIKALGVEKVPLKSIEAATP